MLATWTKELLFNNLDPWTIQEPSMTIEEIIELVEQENLVGGNLLIGSQKANLLMVIRKVTPWVGDVHLVVDNDNPWETVRTIKKIQKEIFANTDFHRLEMKTHMKNVCKLAERCGWSKEGEHREAVATPIGSFITEYSYGLLRED